MLESYSFVELSHLCKKGLPELYVERNKTPSALNPYRDQKVPKNLRRTGVSHYLTMTNTHKVLFFEFTINNYKEAIYIRERPGMSLRHDLG